VHAIKPILVFLLLFLVVIFVQGQERVAPTIKKDTIPIKVDSLKAAIVIAVIRPRIKGDTLEYNVEQMVMQPNAVVEELLRRLPGLQIDINGNITYNGEKISHLLVDGQDIFGSSPTMVTRNFDASKIALVQILDKKSDDAIFTGIDDGSRTKTLNLVLKEGAKNGYFGKVEAAVNTEKYYNVEGAMAAFRKKEQFTAIGMTSNTGILSASTDGAGIDFLYGIPDPLGASAGDGIPRYSAAAIHYANTWGRAGDHADGNYQYSHYFTQPITSTESFQTQADGVYGQRQQSQSFNIRDQHWLDAHYDWAPNNNSAFKINFRGSETQQHNQFESTGSSTFNDTLVNSSQQTIRDQMCRQYLLANLAWRTRIGKKAGRIFSVTSGLTKINVMTNGYLYSTDQFYEPSGVLQSIDTVDQRKRIISHALNTNESVNFTNPLWTGAILGISYGFASAADRPVQATYDKEDGKYQEIVDSLSSYLITQTLNQHITLSVQGATGSLRYTVGNEWLDYRYHQKDLMADSTFKVHYTNWAPRVLINYIPNHSTSINFNYNVTTQEPSITQLAPITNNNNPLYITIGNPDLKPGLNQAFQLGLHRFNTWQINGNLNVTFTTNNISDKITTDILGRQISQPVNVNGGRGASTNWFIGRKIAGVDMGLHIDGTYSQEVTYINADLSRNNACSGGGGFSLNKYVTDKYSLQLNANFIYFDQVSSINTAAPVHYWAQKHSGALVLWLISHYEIGTSATYTWQERTSAFAASTAVLLWNNYISRNLMHNKLVVKAQFNNVLNQNAGISRTSSANVNTETSTNILGRIWMLSAIYHFDKKFKQKN
jgi:Outer membrane protein beta-barrel family